MTKLETGQGVKYVCKKIIVIDHGIWDSIGAGRKYLRYEGQKKISRINKLEDWVIEELSWKDRWSKSKMHVIVIMEGCLYW